jgi:4,5-DOPA dioxygenase extradiol
VKFSSLFISHGAPTLPIANIPAREFLAGLGGQLPRPRAIVAVSPHWLTRERTVKSPPRFTTWHDFAGFPDELYDLEYAAPGDPRLRDRVRDLLGQAGAGAVTTDDLRLDHGVWVPLLLMYPKADVPVVQVSATSDTPRDYYELGRALAPLAGDGVLLVGSGGAVHNLGALDLGGDAPPPAWATAFEAWLRERLQQSAVDEIVAFRERAPGLRRAHPTDDHFLPLLVALGAASERPGPVDFPVQGFEHGSLSRLAVQWG